MPRTKEFEVEHALREALELFWSKGYEATSVQDLSRRMKLQKGSLYAAFGSKRELFLSALDRYRREGFEALQRELRESASPYAAMEAFLVRVVQSASCKEGSRGCFCVNTMVELAPHDAQIAGMLRKHGEEVEVLFAQTIERARALGELPPGVAAKTLAQFLYNGLLGLSVSAKTKPESDKLLEIVRVMLSVLRPVQG